MIVSLSLVSGLATYLILTGLTPIVPRNEVVRVVLGVNIILIIAMIAVIAWQVARTGRLPIRSVSRIARSRAGRRH